MGSFNTLSMSWQAKSGELPSIEEELASMFPIGSEKRRSKKQNTTQRENSCLSNSSLSTRKDSSPPNSPEPPQSDVDEGSISMETVKPGRKKTTKTKKGGNKRTLSDSSSTSSMPVAKRQKGPKPEKNSALNSVGSPDEGTDGAAASKSPEPGVPGDGPGNEVMAPSPASSHNSTSVARRSASPAVPGSHNNSESSTPIKSSGGLLSRPIYVSRPVTPPLDVRNVTDVLKQKKVVASELKFGFLGLGIMGQGILKNLLNSGHQVVVWNRTPAKCRDFVRAGAIKGQTPADVVQAADITFCCVSDPQVAKEVVFGNCGVLQEIGNNKGYVEMTSIDPETSADISEAIIARNGRFLEAPVSGSKKPAEEGTLVILAAGDRSLFMDCNSCFKAMGQHAFYLGDVGNGSKMNLILNMLLGTTLASLAEAMALADRAGLNQRDLIEILQLGSMNCSAIVEKGKAIIEGTFPTNMPLQHMQKDLKLALSIGDHLEQPLPLAASAQEIYKHAKRMGYSEHDVSAVYIRARF